MPAIAGVVGHGQLPEHPATAIMSALADLGSDGSATNQLGEAWFGVQFAHTLPEDDFDRQPYVGAGGSFLLAADARIDNREEIAAALNISAPELTRESEAALLQRGWERWGIDLVDRLLGDIALAVWDSSAGELALVRAPLSNRPLFYHRGQGFIAFASLPSALFAIPTIRREPDIARMADLMAGDIYRPGEATMFRGIESVPQGHAIILRNGSKRSVRLWELDGDRAAIGVAEAGEAIRAELDRAVKAQSRRWKGALACQLSSGRDSSAVSCSAAQFDPNVIALTAAPRADFPPVEDSHWLADESGIAAETARKAGLRHIVCRSSATDVSRLLEMATRAHFQPIGNPVNLPWIAATCTEASRHGASVLLTGGCGNFGLSLGGLGFLGEFWRERGLPAWWRLAHQIRGRGAASWRNLLSISFGQLVPQAAYHTLWRLSGRGSPDRYDLPLLRQPFRGQAEHIRHERFGDVRAPSSRRQLFADILMSIENGDKYSLATWNVDVRDPTADRRFIELCYSLPVEAFIGADEARPAYAAAFWSRLPKAVIEGRQAGYQAADWFETIRREEVRNAFRTYARHPLVDHMLDLKAIDGRIDNWPLTKGDRIETYEAYCNQLLASLALASFINVHFPH